MELQDNFHGEEEKITHNKLEALCKSLVDDQRLLAFVSTIDNIAIQNRQKSAMGKEELICAFQ